MNAFASDAAWAARRLAIARGEQFGELIMAFDKSNRFKDADGRLHIRATNISAARVNGYRGAEIPGATALGLDPDRVYQLLRDPEELAKAAETFNNIQLLSTHKALNAENPQEHLVAGSTGTDARFESPYLVNSMVIWRQEDIDDVESREKCQLSSAYYYTADMTPGVYQGQTYDGIMRGIRGNHVAIVEAGRAGPDVLVADSANPMETQPMTARLSPRALFLKGAITAYLRPKLLSGTVLALDAALANVTDKNFRAEKSKAITAIIGMAGSKLAADATLNDMHDFVDRLDGETVEAQDWEDDDAEAMDAAEVEEENAARKKEREAKMSAEDRKKARDARRMGRDAARKTAADKSAMDKAAADKKAADAKRAKDAEGETEEEKKKREETEAKEREAEDAKRAVDGKKAMDAAITTGIASATAKLRADMIAAAKAREDVRPLVGVVNIALDSADEIYTFALDTLKVDHTGVEGAALGSLFKAIPRPNARLAQPAMDAASGSGAVAMFPALGRIRQ